MPSRWRSGPRRRPRPTLPWPGAMASAWLRLPGFVGPTHLRYLPPLRPPLPIRAGIARNRRPASGVRRLGVRSVTRAIPVPRHPELVEGSRGERRSDDAASFERTVPYSLRPGHRQYSVCIEIPRQARDDRWCRGDNASPIAERPSPDTEYSIANAGCRTPDADSHPTSPAPLAMSSTRVVPVRIRSGRRARPSGRWCLRWG